MSFQSAGGRVAGGRLALQRVFTWLVSVLYFNTATTVTNLTFNTKLVTLMKCFPKPGWKKRKMLPVQQNFSLLFIWMHWCLYISSIQFHWSETHLPFLVFMECIDWPRPLITIPSSEAADVFCYCPFFLVKVKQIVALDNLVVWLTLHDTTAFRHDKTIFSAWWWFFVYPWKWAGLSFYQAVM